MTEKVRKIAIIIGSQSDFTQCKNACSYLKEAVQRGLIEIICPVEGKEIIVNSIHRHEETTLKNLEKLVAMGVDAIIAGAGKAAHLPGMLDSHLRNKMRNDHVVVFAVAFKHKSKERSTQAAILSIDEVPGTQVIFDEKTHVGENGMLTACIKAAETELPKIVLSDLISDSYHTIAEILEN